MGERVSMPGGTAGPDPDRILAVAQEIAFPRYPGSEGNLRAIALLKERFGETGLQVDVEEFSYDIRPVFRLLSTVLMLSGVLLLASALSLGMSALVAALLAGTAFLAPGSLLVWSPWLERLYRRDGPTVTSNVMAQRKVAAPTSTLILIAHHDSKSQNLSLPWRASLTMGAVLGALVLLAILSVAWIRGDAGAYVDGALISGGLSAACLFVLSTLRSGNESPGGVDNAGSVGVLVELARTLPAELPEDVELIFLSPGAEEDHMIGAMRWLDRHRDLWDRPRVMALNLDGVGIPGRITLLERYGLGRLFAPHLSQVTRRAAERLRLRVRGILLPPAMGVDAIPFLHRGIPCLTLASGSLGRASLAVHSRNDHCGNLDPGMLHDAARLVWEVACDLVGGQQDTRRRDRSTPPPAEM